MGFAARKLSVILQFTPLLTWSTVPPNDPQSGAVLIQARRPPLS
jgi:hypothetical protein